MPRDFSKETKRLAYNRCAGHCEGCTAPLSSGNTNYDHVVPWGLTFDSSLDNCQVLCNTCHRDKTAGRDLPMIAEAKREADFYCGVTGPGLGHCPLPGGRLSRLKRTFRHGVVTRFTQAEMHRLAMANRYGRTS